MIVVPHHAPPARRWLAHLLRTAEGSVRAGDPFDDDFPFEDGAVLQLARRMRVAPLLHRAMVEGRIREPLTVAFRSACERLYYATIRKNAVLLEAGHAVLSKLAGAEVVAAPIKGWDFLVEPSPLYENPGTRPMDDLDLIVAPADRERAMRSLVELGFQRVTASPLAHRAGHEIAYHRRDAGVDVFVELHWSWSGPESLMRDYAFPGDRFLEELCGPGAESPRRPTRLGHLVFGAVHATRHVFDRWIWLVDLHRLVTRSPVDWDELVGTARRLRMRGPLYAALSATRELLRSPIPREVLGALRPGPVRRRLLHRSLAASAVDRGPGSAWAAKLLLGESWWDVARTAAWAASPGEGWYAARGEVPGRGRRGTHPLRTMLR